MTNQTQFTDFPLDYYNEINEDQTLYDEIERRLLDLRGPHTDMTAASINIRNANLGTESGVEVTITVEIRPDAKASTVVAATAKAAAKGALDGIERQVREQRDRLRGY
jgi:ribosome-associated translation inhibitor RaiA